jgi:hypothetical protein
MTLPLASLSLVLLGWALMLMNRRDGVTDRDCLPSTETQAATSAPRQSVAWN